jgi:hypothetical protein
LGGGRRGERDMEGRGRERENERRRGTLYLIHDPGWAQIFTPGQVGYEWNCNISVGFT